MKQVIKWSVHEIFFMNILILYVFCKIKLWKVNWCKVQLYLDEYFNFHLTYLMKMKCSYRFYHHIINKLVKLDKKTLWNLLLYPLSTLHDTRVTQPSKIWLLFPSNLARVFTHTPQSGESLINNSSSKLAAAFMLG